MCLFFTSSEACSTFWLYFIVSLACQISTTVADRCTALRRTPPASSFCRALKNQWLRRHAGAATLYYIYITIFLRLFFFIFFFSLGTCPYRAGGWVQWPLLSDSYTSRIPHTRPMAEALDFIRRHFPFLSPWARFQGLISFRVGLDFAFLVALWRASGHLATLSYFVCTVLSFRYGPPSSSMWWPFSCFRTATEFASIIWPACFSAPFSTVALLCSFPASCGFSLPASDHLAFLFRPFPKTCERKWGCFLFCHEPYFPFVLVSWYIKFLYHYRLLIRRRFLYRTVSCVLGTFTDGTYFLSQPLTHLPYVFVRENSFSKGLHCQVFVKGLFFSPLASGIRGFHFLPVTDNILEPGGWFPSRDTLLYGDTTWGETLARLP